MSVATSASVSTAQPSDSSGSTLIDAGSVQTAAASLKDPSFAAAARRSETAMVIGSHAVTNSKLKTARKIKKLDLFISRLNADMSALEVEESALEVIRADDGLVSAVASVNCNQLK